MRILLCVLMIAITLALKLGAEEKLYDPQVYQTALQNEQ